VFRRTGSSEAFRGGVAIGDQVIDLAAIAHGGVMSGPAAQAVNACIGDALNDFLAMGAAAWRALRHALFDLLKARRQRPARQCAACQPGADGRGGDERSRADRRLHRLLHLHPPRT
jgi:fumarylacetoacetase